MWGLMQYNLINLIGLKTTQINNKNIFQLKKIKSIPVFVYKKITGMKTCAVVKYHPD